MSIVSETSSVAAHPLDEAVRALELQFQRPFQVLPLTGGSLQAVEGVTEDDSLMALARTAQTADRPLTAASDGQSLLAVPLDGTGVPAGIAVAACDDPDPARVQRQAELVLEVIELRSQVDALNLETESLVEQVATSFEELSLIRSLAKYLVLQEFSAASAGSARSVIEELAPAMEARGVVLVQTEPTAKPADDWCLRWAGEQFLDLQQCKRLITCTRAAAEQGPVLRNGLSGQNQDPRWPELAEFILVEVRSPQRLLGWLIACNRVYRQPEMENSEGFTTVQATLLVTAASMLAANFNNLELLQQKDALFTEMIRALVNALDARDPYTCGHSERVALFAERLARQCRLSNAECRRVYLSGLLHDLGKIAVPDELLRKPGKLTDVELATFAEHPQAGWGMLHQLAALRDVLPGLLHHHERYDGQGYPHGLHGGDIPLEGRIIAVCDAFDAMTSDRPYRQGMQLEKALAILREGSGSQWDPELITAFFACVDDMLAIRDGHLDSSGRDRGAQTTAHTGSVPADHS